MSMLRLTNLTINRGKKILCRDLSLTIENGDYWAILGANGCGKTTLLHTMSGQHQPASGQIHLNETPLHACHTRRIARAIGILLQDTQHHFPQTVFEYCRAARFPHLNLLTAHHHSPADLDITTQALEIMQLTAQAKQNIQTLSGGEQRRAAIAALLIQSPQIFLLDEPANHLDLHHQILMMNVFASLAASKLHAVVMSLHDINLAARYCNKILMLFSDGSSMHGTRDEMLRTEYLSRLYHHPIDVIRAGEQTYWLPE